MKRVLDAHLGRRALLGACMAAVLTGCGIAASPAPTRSYDPFTNYPLGVAHDCRYGMFDERTDVNNLGDPSLGCAHQNNISAMLVNPADIDNPRDMGPADAKRRTEALSKYRSGEDTATQADAKGSTSLVSAN